MYPITDHTCSELKNAQFKVWYNAVFREAGENFAGMYLVILNEVLYFTAAKLSEPFALSF